MQVPAPLQQTLARPARITGRGLFGGRQVTVHVQPAPDNHGIVFARTDLGGARIPALVHYVVRRPRRSALRLGEAVVETTEHLLSALAGLGIDNALVEIDGMELPGLDGSSQPYVQAFHDAGLANGQAARRMLVLEEPLTVRHEDAVLAALPSAEPGLQVLYELDYAGHPAIGRQLRFFASGQDDYAGQIAPARTFVLEEEAKALRAAGVGVHLTPRDVLVFGAAGPLDGNAQRFDDEPVRHKILDLIGDLALVGTAVQARIVAVKSGHALNQALARKLADKLRQQRQQSLAINRPVFDVRRLERMLPHRYPMLLVDRVIEIQDNQRVLGVKNVTVNEPFFQGHFPGVPIMPGVLVVEAMAQLSGVLINQSEQHKGKLAVLLSLDRVKLRRPIVPGDQLILEAEVARLRATIAHMRCRAYVGQEIAAEAEVKFMLVDPQQI